MAAAQAEAEAEAEAESEKGGGYAGGIMVPVESTEAGLDGLVVVDDVTEYRLFRSCCWSCSGWGCRYRGCSG